jgi:phosphonate transport system substrate-binding protein
MKKSRYMLMAAAAVSLICSAAAFASSDAPRKYLTLAVVAEPFESKEPGDLIAKYAPFAKALSARGAKEVRVLPVATLDALEAGMKSGKYDFVTTGAADVPARAVRDYGYRPVMKGRSDGAMLFIVGAEASIPSLFGMTGQQLGLPAEASYATRVAMAALAEKGVTLKDVKFSFHKDPSVIGYAVRTGMRDVGAVMAESIPGQDWEKKGGKIIYRGRGLPSQPFVASKAVSEADVAKVRELAVALGSSAEGLAILKAAGLPVMAATDDSKVLTELLAYLDTGINVAKGASPMPAMATAFKSNGAGVFQSRERRVIIPNVATKTPAAETQNTASAGGARANLSLR